VADSVKNFAELVAAGQPTGEVVAVNGFVLQVRGLSRVSVSSVIMFETGGLGLIHGIDEQIATVLQLDTTRITTGVLAVLYAQDLMISVGPALKGQIVDPLGRPREATGLIETTASQPLFAQAPALIERAPLKEQLVSGVVVVDMLFPIVLGQRITIIGDSKAGKTSFALQMAIYQARLGRTVIYCLIGKRKDDVGRINQKIEAAAVRQNFIIVMADIFDALPVSYLAPFAAAAIGEYFWHQQNEDVVVIYDDLSAHAKTYRELSLLMNANPGRESYPSDMFHLHSSLLERAGKLESNGKTMSVIPLLISPNNDITGYLPTNMISITDGQIVFDLEEAHKGRQPAVNTGLSVSRVGGITQHATFKNVAVEISRSLVRYNEAKEYAQFGSEVSAQTQVDLRVGEQLLAALQQTADQHFTLNEQYIVLKAILSLREHSTAIHIDELRKISAQAAVGVTSIQQLDATATKVAAKIQFSQSLKGTSTT